MNIGSGSNPGRSPFVVCLIGFMGAGKSTVGAELGRRLGWRFQDLDDVIEAANGSTVSEIFKRHGEAAFRKMESAALRSLLDSRDASLVLALGGGAFAQAANRNALGSADAKVVFLAASASELWRRCARDSKARPLQQNEKLFSELLEKRLPSYRQAHLTVNTEGKDVADIAAEIESSLALVPG